MRGEAGQVGTLSMMGVQRRQYLYSEWKKASISPSHANDVSAIARFIINHESRYATVSSATGCPFWVVGIFHYRESSFDWNTHLANGDPLFDRHGNLLKTTHVPAGLGPFRTWEEGAIGALHYEHGGYAHYHWDVANALENIEAYNGMGYANLGVMNPYLFSFSNLYVHGKYGSDGHYNPKLVDAQCGAVPIMQSLISKGISIADIPV